MSSAWPLTCPNCGSDLLREPRVLRCPRGHSFDIAREGYINLLIPPDRERGIEGDSQPQLEARRRVFERGVFLPLLDTLTVLSRDVLDAWHMTRQDPAAVLDIGCGEGYYIGGIAEGLASTYPQMRFAGFDVSRAAMRMAARRHPQVVFAVANVRRRIYAPPASAALLLNIFAPRNPAEFARLVAPGGTLAIVIPSADHLASLRERFDLLDVPEDKQATVVRQFAPHFELKESRPLRYDVQLDASTAHDIIAMGPNAHHGGSWSIPNGGVATTTVSLVILQLQRTDIRST